MKWVLFFILKIIIINSAFYYIYINKLQAKVNNYKVVNYYVKDNKENLFLVIREFLLNDKPHILVINCSTYETLLLYNFSYFKKIKYPLFLFKKSSFEKAFSLPPLKHGKNTQELYITVDLCPSHKKGFEIDFFKDLINYGKNHNKIINIGVALSASWAKKHYNEFTQLKKWHENKDINITWVNHSYSHYYSYYLPNSKNFMLNHSNNTYDEVINNEIYMIENGVIPSIFFRFPGLIYNNSLLKDVQKFSLIGLDSNAWLAKTKGDFTPGSIILLHGNKNEHIGIMLFLNLLKKGAFNNYNFAPINNILLPTYKHY